MPAKSYTIPQRSSSRAASVADIEAPGSGSTVREDDVDMQAGSDAADEEKNENMFGRRSKELIEVIRNLESLGIKATLSSLPKFVVVGDQSHGKSSIIEAICGISLPRSSVWSCKISLERRYVTDRSRKWRNTEADSVHFSTVYDQADLERILRLAQLAILSPNDDPATVLHLGTTSGQQLSFSFNAIDLYISGHDLPELSMVDLPGSINVAPEESEQHLVAMIEKLIKWHVEDEKALILLVASMDQDLETSTAFRFVRNFKALGRSMGVLTKPDLLGKSATRIDHVRRILKGDVFKLARGWFVTKNSSQEDLDRSITHAEARKAEEQFFNKTPWSAGLLDHEDRFGTRNLQVALSSQLVSHIESELPDIIGRVEARLNEVSRQLEQMPEQPTFPSQTVIEEIQKLAGSVTQFTQGNDNDTAFRTKLKDTLRKFRAQLQAARPQVLLGTPGYKKPVLSLDSDDDTLSDAQTPSKKRKNNEGRSTPSASTASAAQSTPSRTDRAVKEEQSVPEGRAVFDLRQIHLALDQASPSDLPDQVHPKVIERMIRQASAPWPALTTNILSDIRDLVAEMLARCITDNLSARANTEMFRQVTQIVETFCSHVLEDETKFINHVVECEIHRPISYAGGLKQSTRDVRDKLQAARHQERTDEHYDTMDAQGLKVPTGDKRKAKSKEHDFVASTLGPDKYDREVHAMAQPLAYYDLASGRLLDTVANHIERGVVFAIETKLQVRLMLELRVTDQEYCAKLLAEDPEREAQRLRLLAEREKLREAIKQLEALPGQH